MTIFWKPILGSNCAGEQIVYSELFSHRGVDFLKEIAAIL